MPKRRAKSGEIFTIKLLALITKDSRCRNLTNYFN